VFGEGFRFKRVGLLMARMGRWNGEGEYADSSMLYYLDPLTSELVPLFKTFYGIKGIDVHPDGTLYGLTNRRNDSGDRMLVTIDPIAEQVTEIGRLRMGDDSDCRIHSDLTIAGGVLYAMRQYHNGTAWQRKLITIDAATGTCVDIPTAADLSLSNLIGLATKDATTLYYVNYLQGTISQTTVGGVATGTPVTITGVPSNNRTSGMTFAAGTLWAADGRSTPGLLFRINPATGVATPVDIPMPYYSKGLSRTPPSME
jgi:hypothetical protein